MLQVKALLMLETFEGTETIQTQSSYANNLDMNELVMILLHAR